MNHHLLSESLVFLPSLLVPLVPSLLVPVASCEIWRLSREQPFAAILRSQPHDLAERAAEFIGEMSLVQIETYYKRLQPRPRLQPPPPKALVVSSCRRMTMVQPVCRPEACFMLLYCTFGNKIRLDL